MAPPRAPSSSSARPAAAPVATILMLLIVLAAIGAVAYFAFGEGAAPPEDAVRVETPPGAAAVSRPR